MPFAQFEKRENPYKEVLFLVLKVTLLHDVFHVFEIVQMVPNHERISNKFSKSPGIAFEGEIVLGVFR